MLILAALLALVVGLSLGLLGGGGSILMVPVLRYVLGIEGHAAIAVSLAVVGATSIAALVSHARRGHVQWRTGLIFGGAGMLGAYLAGSVAHFVSAALLLVAFSGMMFATAFAMLRQPRGRGKRAASSSEGEPPARAEPLSDSAPLDSAPPRLPLLKIMLEGLVVGAVTGFVGAGGGFLVVPALVILGQVPMQIAVGTSLLVIALKSFAGLAGHAGGTPLDWTLIAILSAAAVAGSFAGSALSQRLSPGDLRRGFGWFVVVMGWFILVQEVPALWGARLHPLLAVLIALAVGAVLRWAVAARLRAHKDERPRQAPREFAPLSSAPLEPPASKS